MFHPQDPMESLKTETNKTKFCGIGEKLSENLIKEGLETYMAIQQYSAKDTYRNMVKDNFSVSKINVEQDTPPRRPVRKVSNTCSPGPPPPPTSAPPPLPSI